MIAALRFGEGRREGELVIREAGFALRSTLPLSAASTVANGVRESLQRLLGRECEVELLEPVAPGLDERRLLLAGALVRRVRGRRADGFVIVRPADAAKLAGLAFGETRRRVDVPLSQLERETLERLIDALVPLCAPLCGTLGPAAPEAGETVAADLAAYFEVRTLTAPRVALGFGVSLDPPEEPGQPLALADLDEIECCAEVRFAGGTLDVPGLARLTCGTVVRLETPLDGAAMLSIGGVAIARGTPGVRGGSAAFALAGTP